MSEVIFRGPGDGEQVGKAQIKAALDEVTIFEYFLEAGGAAGALHQHRGQVDSFYVIEGELEFPIGQDRFQRAPKGLLVLAPPGAVYAFPRAVSQRARFINIHAPGGFEKYIRKLVEVRAEGPVDPGS